MTTSKSLIQEIKDSPADDAAKLAYAEFLKSQGNPQGQLIEDQCRIAQLGENSPEFTTLKLRIALLSDQVHQKLHDTLGLFIQRPQFEKGLLVGGSILPDQFCAHADRFPTTVPFLERIYFGTTHSAFRTNDAQELVRYSAHIAHLKEVGFCCAHRQFPAPKDCADECLEILLPHLPSLERLRVPRSEVTEKGTKIIATSQVAPQLTHLDLDYNFFGIEALSNLIQSSKLNSLQKLSLENCSLTPETVRLFTESTSLAALRRLCLSRNRVGINALWELLDSEALKQLEHLDLRNTRRAFKGEKKEPYEKDPFLASIQVQFGNKPIDLDEYHYTDEELQEPNRKIEHPNLSVLVLSDIHDEELDILLSSLAFTRCKIEVEEEPHLKHEWLSLDARERLAAHNASIPPKD